LHRNGPPCLQYMLTQMSYAEPIHYRNQARTKLYSILIGANISPQEIREWMRSYFQRLDKTSLVNFNRHMAKLETSLVYWSKSESKAKQYGCTSYIQEGLCRCTEEYQTDIEDIRHPQIYCYSHHCRPNASSSVQTSISRPSRYIELKNKK